jgi:hypothetical protein
MTRTWVQPLIRVAVYMYFAAGMTLLFGEGMVWAVRQQADKRFAAFFLATEFVGMFAVLALASWNSFQRPISRRKWFILCLLSSLGILELLLGTTSRGGTAS